MKKLFVLALAILIQLTAFANEPFWKTVNKSLQVKGGVGIEQFVEAIFGYKPNEWDRDPVYDKKNGFFSYFEEGAGSVRYNVSYWNRNDGKKLVIMSYCATDFGKKMKPKSYNWGSECSFDIEDDGVLKDESINRDCGFFAWTYDDKTKTLVPLQAPPFNNFEQPVRKSYFLSLPQKGKDIKVCEMVKLDEEVYHTLKWNGTTFDFKKEGNGVVSFFFTDPKANIRTAPNGTIVHTLQENGSWGVGIIKIENGWCLINGSFLYEYEEDGAQELTGSKSGYWVHNSRIGATGMGNGGVTLHSSPDAKSSVVFKSDDYTLFHPIELRGEWIKVRIDGTKTEGWMKTSEICSNPLTNCC